MKLILKDGQEITVTRMNNMYAFENFKDGQGNPLDKNTMASIILLNSDYTFEELKEKLKGENTKDFKIAYGEEEKSFPELKMDSIGEEIANERSIITISLVNAE